MDNTNTPRPTPERPEPFVMRSWPGTKIPMLAVLLVIAASVLAFDLSMPLGVAGGVPYVALVLSGYWLPKHRHIYVLAFIASVLTVIGYLGSPDGGVYWVVLTNRGLALFAIWISAFLVVSYKKIEKGHRVLSYAVDQSGDMIFITDLSGDITYVNQEFCKVTGYECSEVLGQNPRILKSDNTPSKLYTQIWTDILAGKTWRGEIQDCRKDGSLFWAAARISPIRDRNEEITHFLAMHDDITARKQTEETLKAAMVDAEIGNRSKTEFIANMSHELRTPLNAIIGFSDLLKDEAYTGPLHDKQLEYVHDIQASGEHLLELINDVLDVSAIEAQSLTLNENLIDPVKAAVAALRIVAPRAKDASVELINAIGAEAPKLYIDERRFKQILLNLLANAIKFTAQGGRVVLSADVVGDGALRFSISDTGIGMDEVELAKALTKFGQVDSTLGRKYEGTGLGLTLAMSLTEAHDGTFALHSKKGVGTTATITFPPHRVGAQPQISA